MGRPINKQSVSPCDYCSEALKSCAKWKPTGTKCKNASENPPFSLNFGKLDSVGVILPIESDDQNIIFSGQMLRQKILQKQNTCNLHRIGRFTT